MLSTCIPARRVCILVFLAIASATSTCLLDDGARSSLISVTAHSTSTASCWTNVDGDGTTCVQNNIADASLQALVDGSTTGSGGYFKFLEDQTYLQFDFPLVVRLTKINLHLEHQLYPCYFKILGVSSSGAL